MAKKFGFALLAQQICDHLQSEWEWMSGENQLVGDSKIEQLLYAALSIWCEVGHAEFNKIVQVFDKENLSKQLDRPEPEYELRPMIVWPQATMEWGRVDFLILAFDYRNGNWRKLVIECDGHDFHERTKEQAARDRSKDRSAVLVGCDSFRFTGSELWRDPLGCAQQITLWAAKGL
ncbi:MAG: hypothetical protein KGL39_20210 [Patescibacteria group bacterium]|nr:hypothetical protein [Patescibacteria group bacterium]